MPKPTLKGRISIQREDGNWETIGAVEPINPSLLLPREIERSMKITHINWVEWWKLQAALEPPR